MKTNFILLFMLFANMVFAQHRNLDKLPQKERDSILIKIANEAIEKYSTGYLRPGNKPYIQDIGYKLNENYKAQGFNEYVDRYHYAVAYLPTEREKKFYKCGYLVKATILADIGKVTSIRYIDDYGYYAGGLEGSLQDDNIVKRKFITIEEALENRKKSVRYIRDTVIPSEILEKERKDMEMRKRRRDSFQMLHLQYLRRRDSIRQQDSIRMTRQQDSIRNVQTENK